MARNPASYVSCLTLVTRRMCESKFFHFLETNIMARRLGKDDIISNIYYDPAEGFGSAKDVYKRAKEEDPTITIQDVRAFLKKQPNKQIRKHRGHNSYTAPFARFQYQIDIMDMVPLTKDSEQKPGKEIKIVKNKLGRDRHLQQTGECSPHEK